MEQLGASEDDLNFYKPLLQEHLKLSGDIMQPNRFGQWMDSLAWFWNISPQTSEEANGWMDECMLAEATGKLVLIHQKSTELIGCEARLSLTGGKKK